MKKPMVKLNYTERDGLLYPNIQVTDSEADDQPLGRFGRMALENLRAEHSVRYMTLEMAGTLMTTMHAVQRQAVEQIEATVQQLLEKKPMPATEDTLARTRHWNSLRRQAEEIVLQEVVLIER